MEYSDCPALELMPKELRLLLEILKTKNLESVRINLNELGREINWNQFLYLTMHHRVYPIVYLKIKNINNKLIPSYVIQKLYQEYKKNTFQMLKLSGEMEQVSELFTENNIRLLFLKGPVIAAELYGDISLRTSKDLDILISIYDFQKVEKLLLNLGYERKEFLTPMWKFRYHHVTYVHPLKNIHLEIHWRLHPQSMNEPSFNELWKRKRISNLTNNDIYFLGKDDLFLYLVAHGGRHGWFRLRWLLDIDQILSGKMTTEESISLLKKYRYHHSTGQRHYLGQALILVSVLLHTPINEEMQLLANKKGSGKLAKMTLIYLTKRANLNLTKSEDELAKYDNRYIIKIKSGMQKSIFILKLIFPNPKDAEVLMLPKPFRFLYIPLRPFLWAKRKTDRRGK
ncbi:putative nucleotidyltransferase-like protein [Peribacillus frigoritolerans]|uniref:nucleotidyltransferase domain-containing protein n=1 Tax=Peribacillus frigoritolerans TaxID=450367 RepID=UPI00119A3AD3|nr:nucleotidyltransferase family protein [Peribacillus frigoritolerans]TWE04183.1 putative nucleotidyltransferase-like protein [Peribacillus frigoritolerans]